MVLGLVRRHIVEHAFRHCGSVVLGTQAVSAADYLRVERRWYKAAAASFGN